MCPTKIDQGPNPQFNVPDGAEQGHGASIQQVEQIYNLMLTQQALRSQKIEELTATVEMLGAVTQELRASTHGLGAQMQQLESREKHLAHQMNVLTGKDSPLQLSICKCVRGVFSALSELFARVWRSLPSVSNLFSAQ